MKAKDKEKFNNPLKGWQILSAISSMVFHTLQCDTKRLLCTISFLDWKMPTPKYRKLNSMVQIGRFDNLPFFYYGQYSWLQKILHTYWNSYRVSNKVFIFQNPTYFRPFLKGPAENWCINLKSVFNVGFKMWTTNHMYFLLKICYPS